jgi:transposase
MSNLFWLSEAQRARLELFFPKCHGKPRVGERRVLFGIIFLDRNGLRWCHAVREFAPHKALCNCSKRWSQKGVFARMMAGLPASRNAFYQL